MLTNWNWTQFAGSLCNLYWIHYLRDMDRQFSILSGDHIEVVWNTKKFHCITMFFSYFPWFCLITNICDLELEFILVKEYLVLFALLFKTFKVRSFLNIKLYLCLTGICRKPRLWYIWRTSAESLLGISMSRRCCWTERSTWMFLEVYLGGFKTIKL